MVLCFFDGGAEADADEEEEDEEEDDEEEEEEEEEGPTWAPVGAMPGPATAFGIAAGWFTPLAVLSG